MLEYTAEDKHIAYMAEIDGENYVFVVRDGEAILEPSSDEMVSQDAVFFDNEKRLILLHSDNKFLYWTIDNEFKILDKDSKDTQVLSPEFILGDSEGNVVEKQQLKEKIELPIARNFCTPEISIKGVVKKPFRESINQKAINRQKQNEQDFAAFYFFFVFFALALFIICMPGDPLALISCSIVIIFNTLVCLL